MINKNHFLVPPQETISLPVHLIRGLAQAGKNSLTRRPTLKSLTKKSESLAGKHLINLTPKSERLSPLEMCNTERSPSYKLEYNDLKFNHSEIVPCNSPQLLLRSENKSELRFLKNISLPKLKSEYQIGSEVAVKNDMNKKPSSKIILGSLSPQPVQIRGANTSRFNNNPFLSQRKTVVLDLDETLIHASSSISSPDYVISRILSDNSNLNIRVSVRPYARDFLRILSELAEIIIFTASLKPYADPILDLLDPKHEYISSKYYRESCIYHPSGFVKDLTILRRNLKDVLIVDNLATSFMKQKENGILIPSWYGDKSDTELLKLLKNLRKMLLYDDVRQCDKNLHNV